MEESILNKIRALLAKAESTEFADEAAAFTAKAVELMGRYAIDEASVRAGSSQSTKITDKKIEVYAPYPLAKMMLLNTIAKHNRCQLINLGKNPGSTDYTAHVFGRSSDIEFVEVLFASLLTQQLVEMNQVSVPVWENTRTFRTAFMAGYAQTIGQRLAKINQNLATETESSTALVLVQDAREASKAATAHYPSTKVATRKVNAYSMGYGSGASAGNKADIGNGKLGATKQLKG